MRKFQIDVQFNENSSAQIFVTASNENAAIKAVNNARITGLKECSDTYFTDMAGALNAAASDALRRGYDIVDFGNILIEPLAYTETRRYSFEIHKNGKSCTQLLHVILYRMESGKYELTHYIF